MLFKFGFQKTQKWIDKVCYRPKSLLKLSNSNYISIYISYQVIWELGIKNETKYFFLYGNMQIFWTHFGSNHLVYFDFVWRNCCAIFCMQHKLISHFLTPKPKVCFAFDIRLSHNDYATFLMEIQQPNLLLSNTIRCRNR